MRSVATAWPTGEDTEYPQVGSLPGPVRGWLRVEERTIAAIGRRYRGPRRYDRGASAIKGQRISALDALAAGVGAEDLKPLAALADGLEGPLDRLVLGVPLDVEEEEVGRVAVGVACRRWGTTRSRSC